MRLQKPGLSQCLCPQVDMQTTTTHCEEGGKRTSHKVPQLHIYFWMKLEIHQPPMLNFEMF